MELKLPILPWFPLSKSPMGILLLHFAVLVVVVVLFHQSHPHYYLNEQVRGLPIFVFWCGGGNIILSLTCMVVVEWMMMGGSSIAISLSTLLTCCEGYLFVVVLLPPIKPCSTLLLLPGDGLVFRFFWSGDWRYGDGTLCWNDGNGEEVVTADVLSRWLVWGGLLPNNFQTLLNIILQKGVDVSWLGYGIESGWAYLIVILLYLSLSSMIILSMMVTWWCCDCSMMCGVVCAVLCCAVCGADLVCVQTSFLII